jgi:hypothetical protein
MDFGIPEKISKGGGLRAAAYPKSEPYTELGLFLCGGGTS